MMSETAGRGYPALRVLFLASAASTHTGRWANAISAEGHQVHLLTLDPVRVHLDSKISCHLPPFPPKWGYIANWPWTRKQVAEIKPDLIHAHYATGYGTLAALVDFHPTILSVWGTDVFEFPRLSPLHRRLLELSLSRADKILSTSHAMATETGRYTDKPIDVTPFGIDLKQFTPRAVNSLFDCDDIVIGTVKTLEKKYGIEYLVRAFALLKQKHPGQSLKLLIVGGGSQDAYLKRLASELGIAADAVFTGPVSHDRTPEFQNMLTISVTLSNAESFGVAVLEASACAKPVVVSNVGGLPEIVEDGVTGIVVEPRNPEHAAHAIERLLADQVLRERMGRAGRERVQRMYDWSDSIAQMQECYREMVT